MANIHLKVCHIGGYEGKILSRAPNHLMGNLSCNVYMKNRLVRLLVHINAHIVPIRMISLVYLLLHVLKHHIHGLPFVIGQVEVRSHMPLGNNQCMPRRYRITVIERHTSCRLTNNFHSSRQTAERTNLPFLPGQLIKMLILIKLIARITFQTLERQPHIALIGVLAMNSMQPEPFFRQVTTHSKKGRSRKKNLYINNIISSLSDTLHKC